MTKTVWESWYNIAKCKKAEVNLNPFFFTIAFSLDWLD